MQNGTIALAGAIILALCRRKSQTRARATGRTSTAPALSNSPSSCRATRIPTSRIPFYWGTEKINGVESKLPLVDKLVFRTIKDEATYLTALRTAKLDILENIRWSAVEELKKNAPQLQWSKWLSMSGTFLSMRVDTKPFDDIRVRRALNLAVNKQEIVKEYYGGNAELFAYPQHPDYLGYFEPLEAMPDSVKELFTYNPEKAKKLLAEAGVPKGFTFKVQVCSCSPTTST